MVQRLQVVFFVATLIVGALLEVWQARGHRREHLRHARRNLTMTALFLALNAVLGGLSAGWLLAADGIGLLHRLALPGPAKLALGIVAVDLVAWLVHVAKHRVPFLWRFHQVHHSDPVLDITSSYRFHPLDIFFGWALSTPLLLALGVPLSALGLHVLYLCVVEQLQHARAAWPRCLERALCGWLVTAATHRVHHDRRHAHHNFGSALAVWDRLAGTHRVADAASPGLDGRDDERHQTVIGMLVMPLEPR